MPTIPEEKVRPKRLTTTLRSPSVVSTTSANATLSRVTSKVGPENESELSKLNKSLERDDSTWGWVTTHRFDRERGIVPRE